MAAKRKVKRAGVKKYAVKKAVRKAAPKKSAPKKSAPKKATAVPRGMHSVTPHIIVDGAAAAIEFYKKAFGAIERMRMPGKEGRLMHASILIGDSTVMLVDEMPEWKTMGPKALNGTPVTIHLYVSDADETFASALAAGATVKMPLADMFWGDRYGVVVDPFGHEWAIATQTRIVTPGEMVEGMKQMK
jgi:uncharacterized glyoxalase superfamily protein PhnB